MRGTSSEGTIADQRLGRKKRGRKVRKSSRIPEGNGCSLNVIEYPTPRKDRRGKEMKPRSSDRNLTKKRAARTKHASDTMDPEDHPPPMKKRKVMATSSAAKKTPSKKKKDSSKNKSESGKGKRKIGMKRQLEMVDGEDAAEPRAKKLTFLDCIKGKERRAEFVAAIESVSKNIKQAITPPKLLEDASKYTRAFITKTKKIKQDLQISELEDFIFHPTSHKKLIDAERMIMKDVKPEGKTSDVQLQCETKILIHTVCFESQNGSKGSKEKKFPLVLIHGFGGGLPVFYKNFHNLSTNRSVYAIDLPGFALSSRVKFPENPEECRQEIVKLLEMWREAMKLEKFILLGHSFGGYLSASYTLKFSSRVRHLILADSWGIIDKSDEKQSRSCVITTLATMLKINPFEIMRNTLGIGRILYDKCVDKRTRKAYGNKLLKYFYHSNAQKDATGEEAFMCISDEYLWPHTAMKPLLVELDSSVSITFLYGKESPYNNDGGRDVRRKRVNVFVPEPIPEVGHHIQAENYQVFNRMVNEICDKVDCDIDRCDKGE